MIDNDFYTDNFHHNAVCLSLINEKMYKQAIAFEYLLKFCWQMTRHVKTFVSKIAKMMSGKDVAICKQEDKIARIVFALSAGSPDILICCFWIRLRCARIGFVLEITSASGAYRPGGSV